ncbi:MAG: helix-turn-helix domain-containing protein [Chitinophagaceae bacterium]|nr:helix-turn-helix domain-containing protein [Chitinophagaceae bacterium]
MYLEKLRKIRNQKGLSQKELGELIGLDQSAYCKIENGSNYLSVPTLLHICKVLHVSVNEILNQNSLDSNIPISYDNETYQEKMALYNNSIKDLELIIIKKKAKLDQLKISRDELMRQN